MFGSTADASAKTPGASVTKKKAVTSTSVEDFLKLPIGTIDATREKLFNDFNLSNRQFGTIFKKMKQSEANLVLFKEILNVTNPVVVLFESYQNANEAMIQILHREAQDATNELTSLKSKYDLLQQQYAESQNELEDATERLTALGGENEGLQEAKAALETKLTLLHNQYEKDIEQVEDIHAKIAQVTANPKRYYGRDFLTEDEKGMGYTIRNDETGAFGAYDPEGKLVRPFKGGTRRRQRRRRGQKSRR